MKVTDKITITNEDNMELMARYPDNYFDLAIVDPPYGIDDKLYRSDYGKNSNGSLAMYKDKRWDIAPNKEYFDELFRISKNQIVWGGNYFNLPLSRCWVIWNKDNPAKNFSSIEMAWTSFDIHPKYYYYAWGGLADGIKGRNKKEKSIHPTQKPIELYSFLLNEFTEKGDKILDTHLGSGSIAIACHNRKFDLTACELDEEYYNAAIKRINNHTSQLQMF
jgi:site-specific DNA-methyltransferase (adenine-specific)